MGDMTTARTQAARAERPWGWFAITAEGEGFKTKLLVLNPRQRFSLQSHAHRKELWTVIAGEGLCTIDGQATKVAAGSFVAIPQGARHRMENLSSTAPLAIAEVQLGDRLDEDDVVRHDDDYGR